jgi:Fe-S-cluster formation regulator IscX/YfhJ
LKPINDNLVTLNNDVRDLKQTANDAYETSDSNVNSIQELQQTINELQTFKHDQEKWNEELAQREVGYKEDIAALKENNAELVEQLDDSINRGMRGNLVLFGVKETENEKFLTSDLVSHFIYQNVYKEDPSVTLIGMRNTIVRAHRSKHNPANDNKVKPRPIFVKFARDDYADAILDKSIKNETYKSTGVKICPQYSRRTQGRRDQALIHRRKLFDNKEIVKGYVDYPAKLFVMYNGERKYTLLKEY